MRKLEQNFKYFIILLIILILGILIFGNYNLNLSLIESFNPNTTEYSSSIQSEYADKSEEIGKYINENTKETMATHKINYYNGINTENIK